MSQDWRPTATLDALRLRAAMLRTVRDFFSARRVLEVETPIISRGAVSDPNIESLSIRIAGRPNPWFLSTSPEFAMKRLIAAGCGDIYQVCKVFRDAEIGRWHNCEFTMIEWYRMGFDDSALMSEVESLIAELFAPARRSAPADRFAYAEAMHRYAHVDIHADTDAALMRAAAAHGIHCPPGLDRDAILDLLMGTVVGPRLGRERPCFVCDYPPSQASLARLKSGIPAVAARFELYVEGIELANGFHELADGAEQRKRFTQDLAIRAARGQAQPPMDEALLAALESGMPDCAGVALGFDRLLAIALGTAGLAPAMAFTIDNA